jgi:hypothetical protein
MKRKLLGRAASSPGPEVIPLEAEMVGIEPFRKMHGLGRTLTYKMIKDGTLPTVKIGRRRLVLLDSARRVFAGLERAGLHRGEAA